MNKNTKFRWAKGIRDYQRFAKIKTPLKKVHIKLQLKRQWFGGNVVAGKWVCHLSILENVA